jgi:hypothetical protein
MRARCQEHRCRHRSEDHCEPNRLEEHPQHNEDDKTDERGEVMGERAHRRSDENGVSIIRSRFESLIAPPCGCVLKLGFTNGNRVCAPHRVQQQRAQTRTS